MTRTSRRPLPAGRMHAGGCAGLRADDLGRRASSSSRRVNLLTLALGALSLLSYVLAYTPLEAGHLALHGRGRGPGRAAAADGLGGRAGQPRPGRLGALRDPLPVAAAALSRDRLALPRGLRPRRLPDARRPRPRRLLDGPPGRSVRDGAAAGDAGCGAARGGRARATSGARWSSALAFLGCALAFLVEALDRARRGASSSCPCSTCRCCSASWCSTDERERRAANRRLLLVLHRRSGSCLFLGSILFIISRARTEGERDDVRRTHDSRTTWRSSGGCWGLTIVEIGWAHHAAPLEARPRGGIVAHGDRSRPCSSRCTSCT